MKKAGLIVSIILLTGVITFTLLTHRTSSNVQLVKFKGIENVANLSKGHLDWMSTTESTKEINAIPAQENDLIYGLSSGNDEGFFVIQIKKQTDKVLNVRMDTLGAYIDERLATLVLDDNESAVSKWLSRCTKDDIRHLQSVFISDSLTENNFQELRKIGKYNSGIGLIIETPSNYAYELQDELKPSWLWLSDLNMSSKGVEYLNKLDHLEYLILTDVRLEKVTFDGLKKLKMLYIDNPDSITFTQLNELPKGLTTLQISNSDIMDLGFLNGNTRLKELTFNHCPLLRDISSLEKFPHVNALSLAKCDSILDLKPINGLKELKWFAPPKNITGQQLNSIIKTSPNIQSLVLMDCQNIKSLNLLKDAHKLSYLALISTPIAPDSLIQFKDLHYLTYEADNSNDSLSIARLQKAMPNTLITAAEPFCMGTGWLIVFFALLILLTLLAVKVRNRISA